MEKNSPMKRIILIALVAAIPLHATKAQELSTAFFLDHYDFGYRINPAFQPDERISGTFGFGVDNINVGSNSNVGLNNFLFPSGGKLVTGLHKDISAESFLGNLPESCTADAKANINIINAGFRIGKKGYGSVELNSRTHLDTQIPRGYFEFLKTAGTNGKSNSFDIRNTNLSVNECLELAFGYSHKLGNRFSFGARVKLQFGLARADMLAEQIKIDVPANSPVVDLAGRGTLSIYAPFISVGTVVKEMGTGQKTVYDINSIKKGILSLAGFGAAFDLGFQLEPMDGLTLSLAAQDLGFIKWNKTLSGVMNYSESVEFSNIRELTDNFGELFNNFEPTEDRNAETQTINFTLRAGARYKMPFYDKLSVGILGSLSGGLSKYSELRLGATVSPVKNVSITANYGRTSFGNVLGCAANFNLGPFGIFIGTDSLALRYTPQFVPVDPIRTTVTAGIVIQFI